MLCDQMVGHFKVEGMTCASCVGAVERAITALEGVKSAEISLTLKRAEVTYFPSVHAENVVEAIEDVGFEASVLNEVQVHSERTDRPSELPVQMTQSSTQLRKVATSIYGVRGVVVKDAQNARLLYDPVKVGARNLLQKLEGVCRYHEEVLEDPSVATLRRMKHMLLLSLPPTIMIVLLVEGFLPDAWEDEIAGIPSAFLYVLLLSAFVQFYCGSIFHEAAWSAALHKTLGHHIGKLTESSLLIALLTLVCYQGFAVIFFANVEGWTWDQSLYFGMVTMSTVGYGDLYPTLWYSQLVGILFILVGIVVVFGQIIDVVNLVIGPLFQKSRDLVERLVPAHYVDITGNGVPDFKVPRRRSIFYGKGLIGPILMLLLFQFISALIFVAVEPEWDLWTAWWYVMVTASTVGYGDNSVNKENTGALIWASIHILLSVGLLAAIIGDLEVLSEERQELLKQAACFEKCFQKETLQSLDMDKSGKLSKHEFVLSMLVKIGKLDPEKDLKVLKNMYDRMDVNKDGSIDLSSAAEASDGLQMMGLQDTHKLLQRCVGREVQQIIEEKPRRRSSVAGSVGSVAPAPDKEEVPKMVPEASTMNTLVSLSTTVSFLYGVLGGFYDFYLRTHRFSLEMSAMFCETSAVLITVLLGGRFMETLAKSKTTQSLHEISAKRPHFARLLEGLEETETEIHYQLIQIGDRLRVLPGEQVPVDGEVTSDGTVYCDESLLTGEAAPVRKQLGSQVVGNQATFKVTNTHHTHPSPRSPFGPKTSTTGTALATAMGANNSLVPCCTEQPLDAQDFQVAEQIAVDEFMPMELAQNSDLQKDRINPWAQLQEDSALMVQCCGPETRAPHDAELGVKRILWRIPWAPRSLSTSIATGTTLAQWVPDQKKWVIRCDDENSLPCAKLPPAKKRGSSSVQGGFIMKASSAGNSTTLARILQLVEDAQTRRPSVQRNVDWIASYFTPVVLVAAVLTLLLWMLQAEDMDGVTFAITRAVSVLVIACPCSFGLATPTAVMMATGLAAKHGCLVKDATVWEKVSSLKCAVLDKTGTITKGRPEVIEVALLPGAHALLQMGLDAVRAVPRPAGDGGPRLLGRLGHPSFPLTFHVASEEILGHPGGTISEMTAIPFQCGPPEDASTINPAESADASAVIGWLLQAVETNSEHPLAKALLAWAQEVQAKPGAALAEDFQHRPGQGVSCSIPGVGKVTAGRTPDSLETHQQLWVKRLQDDACVVVALSLESVGPLALLALRDQLQDGAKEAVEQLQLRGFRVLMCTGDALNTAHAVASRVGITEVRASCLPENKAALVQELSTETEVLMVGDGLNDAAALASASVGVAIGTGTQVTMESAQVILLGSKLSDLIFFLNLSRATMRTIYRNFAWALGFNVIGLPLAAGLGSPWGLQLPPSFCGSAMAFSSVLVVSSSLMLGLRYR
eukprot:s480_g17.t3